MFFTAASEKEKMPRRFLQTIFLRSEQPLNAPMTARGWLRTYGTRPRMSTIGHKQSLIRSEAMGREILRVPLGFQHPKDNEGEYIAGAHLEQLWYTDDTLKTAYQVYENISEGSPVSPIFPTVEELRERLGKQGVA